MPVLLVPIAVYAVKLVCTLTSTYEVTKLLPYFLQFLSPHQRNASHGANDVGHVDKGANASNKEKSGVSDMYMT